MEKAKGESSFENKDLKKLRKPDCPAKNFTKLPRFYVRKDKKTGKVS